MADSGMPLRHNANAYHRYEEALCANEERLLEALAAAELRDAARLGALGLKIPASWFGQDAQHAGASAGAQPQRGTQEGTDAASPRSGGGDGGSSSSSPAEARSAAAASPPAARGLTLEAQLITPLVAPADAAATAAAARKAQAPISQVTVETGAFRPGQ